MLLDCESFNLGGHPKSKLLAFNQPNRRLQDVIRFELNVFGHQKLEIEGFNILEPCPWMLKASIWMVLDSQTLNQSSKIQVDHEKSTIVNFLCSHLTVPTDCLRHTQD